jgi:four helix bundle protein
MKSFEELELLKEGRKYRIEESNLTKTFPLEEKYKLVDQLLRSSRSLTANIAEGHGRFHYQENIQYCRQTRRSLAESIEHLICGYDEGYLDKNQLDEFRVIYAQCLKLLNGYILYLKKRKEEG